MFKGVREIVKGRREGGGGGGKRGEHGGREEKILIYRGRAECDLPAARI